MRKEVEEWWKQEKRGLITAENCKNSKDYYACAFFCQQSVEKGLKARYIAKKRISPGTTHSLIYLATETDISSIFYLFLRQLTPEFVTTRYLDAAYGTPYELYDEDMVNEILKSSKEELKWIGSQMEL
ncbi:MAG: HEPN domain-containing protein [Halobacteriota archaeon]|nr:HEPN domain-containing protein [Halobacteriota archaeon]